MHAVTHYFLHGQLSNLLSLHLSPQVMGFPYMFYATSAAAENTTEADEVKKFVPAAPSANTSHDFSVCFSVPNFSDDLVFFFI